MTTVFVRARKTVSGDALFVVLVSWLSMAPSTVAVVGFEDCNENGTDDADDIAACAGDPACADCDGNGVPDVCQIRFDSTAPGGPYYCDPGAPFPALSPCDADCNGTGIPDGCELVGNDCNDDGRPDECGVADPCLLEMIQPNQVMNVPDTFETGGDDRTPFLATDGQGTWILAWKSQDELNGTVGNGANILFRRSVDDGNTWTLSAALHDSFNGYDDYNPRLATDGKGTWLALWQRQTVGSDREMMYSRSTDNGATWSDQEILVDECAVPIDGCGSFVSFRIATDGHGHWMVVFNDNAGSDQEIWFVHSADNGVTWSAYDTVNNDAATDRISEIEPTVASDGSGTWIVAWNRSLDIVYARSTDNGSTWTDPALVSNISGFPKQVELGADGSGGWLAVWVEDSAVQYAQSNDAGQTWSGGVVASGIVTAGAELPRLACGGPGKWGAIWTGVASNGASNFGVPYYAYTLDGGSTWSTPTILIDYLSELTFEWNRRPHVAGDGRGHWIAAWETNFDGGLGADVYIFATQLSEIGIDCDCDAAADTCVAPCTDGDVCTDDFCLGPDCDNPPNYDTETSCCNPSTGALLPLDDGNACTVDSCGVAGGVIHQDTTPKGSCCDPATGDLATISDGNPCTEDTCQPDGSVTHEDATPPDQCCTPADGTLTPIDDGLGCTDDICQGDGTVEHVNNCPGGTPLCDLDDGLCKECFTTADCATDLECDPGGFYCFRPCEKLEDCADLDDDGRRDDVCVWWTCAMQQCQATDIVYADMGGQFGVCPVDGTADNNDRNHALNCFADDDAGGDPTTEYPCEDAPPTAYNVDAGGQFGSCIPDGVCDGNDAFAALNAFAGTSTCQCPLDGQPMPGVAWTPPPVIDRVRIALRATRARVRSGEEVAVEVYITGGVKDLRGYQLHPVASPGLELVDLVIETRRDHAFGGLPYWEAYNLRTGQLVAGLDSPGVASTQRELYLATLIYRVRADGPRRLSVDLLHDPVQAGHRTFLFPTAAHGMIEIAETRPAVVVVER